MTAPAGTELVAVIDLPVMVSASVGRVPAAVAVAPLAAATAATTIPAVRAVMRFKRFPLVVDVVCPAPRELRYAPSACAPRPPYRFAGEL